MPLLSQWTDTIEVLDNSGRLAPCTKLAMATAMLIDSDALEVIDIIVECVFIRMMDLVSIRDWTVSILPDLPVQRLNATLTIGNAGRIIPTVSYLLRVRVASELDPLVDDDIYIGLRLHLIHG
jgi:hypothetical protein